VEILFDRLELGPGTHVALEGVPIYLADEPGEVHQQGARVLSAVIKVLAARGCVVKQHILLDEVHTGGRDIPTGNTRSYLALSSARVPTRLVYEGELVEGALGWLDTIPQKLFSNGSGNSGLRKLHRDPQPLLTRHGGDPACALLDATFQLGKVADLSIIVHPKQMDVNGSVIDFQEQQAGMLAVLQSIRHEGQRGPWMPWKNGVVHLWLDESGHAVELTRTFQGRGERILQFSRKNPILPALD